ncbi:MAG: hypothetical protein NTW04_02955, partial [Elusimicrobia bacterium]|nr:hypothetical protein [Elusimicrobiota bacterium]
MQNYYNSKEFLKQKFEELQTAYVKAPEFLLKDSKEKVGNYDRQYPWNVTAEFFDGLIPIAWYFLLKEKFEVLGDLYYSTEQKRAKIKWNMANYSGLYYEMQSLLEEVRKLCEIKVFNPLEPDEMGIQLRRLEIAVNNVPTPEKFNELMDKALAELDPVFNCYTASPPLSKLL